jgi:hypothetical protein
MEFSTTKPQRGKTGQFINKTPLMLGHQGNPFLLPNGNYISNQMSVFLVSPEQRSCEGRLRIV